MNAGGRKAQNHITGSNIFTGNEVFSVYNAYGKAGHIVVSLGIEAGHFRRFAAKEGTSGLNARIGHAFDDFRHQFRFQFAGGNIVQKEEGSCTLYQYVIDAHGYAVLSDGIMNAHFDGQAELGAYAVGAGNKDGIFRQFILQTEQSAEAANIPHNATGIGGLH